MTEQFEKLMADAAMSQGVISELVATNDEKYQLIKAAEECSELTTALLQYINKDGKKTTAKDVIAELADVRIRLHILEEVFGMEDIQEAYMNKINKFKEYLDTEQYVGKI